MLGLNLVAQTLTIKTLLFWFVGNSEVEWALAENTAFSASPRRIPLMIDDTNLGAGSSYSTRFNKSTNV